MADVGCRAGRFEIGVQAGHPLGFWFPAYPGEVALGRVLADTGGELARLRRETRQYPDALRTALTGAAVWDAGFSAAMAARSYPARRGAAADTARLRGPRHRSARPPRRHPGGAGALPAGGGAAGGRGAEGRGAPGPAEEQAAGSGG